MMIFPLFCFTPVEFAYLLSSEFFRWSRRYPHLRLACISRLWCPLCAGVFSFSGCSDARSQACFPPGTLSPDLPLSTGGSSALLPLHFRRRGCWRGWACNAASFPPPFASPQLLWHDSESATAEASEDALRGKRSVEERPLFLFFAPLPPSLGGRAL